MSRRLLLPSILPLLLAGAPALAEPPYPLSIENQRTARGYRLQARNLGPAPVSLSLRLSDQVNLASERSYPQVVVVPPNGGSVDLGEVYAATASRAFSFRTQYRWLLGDLRARHAPETLYRLPWPDGQRFAFGQSPGGPLSTHTQPDSEYAVDIPMPEGTPIVAARAGRVIATAASQTFGGQTPDMLSRANVVQILHDDRSIGLYAHLAPGGVRVASGQYVPAGQVIGLAGSTGYSSGPHLHFAVLTVRLNGDRLEHVSQPFNFYVGNPPQTIVPRLGLAVTAQYREPYQAATASARNVTAHSTPPPVPGEEKNRLPPTAVAPAPSPWWETLLAVPASIWSGILLLLALLFAWRSATLNRD